MNSIIFGALLFLLKKSLIIFLFNQFNLNVIATEYLEKTKDTERSFSLNNYENKINQNENTFLRINHDFNLTNLPNEKSSESDIFSVDFKKLLNTNLLKEKSKIGKNDPFSLSNEEILIGELKSFSLLGVVATDLQKIAIVQYKGNNGEIRIGEIGGKTTNFLPNNVSLLNIIIDKPMIILGSGDKKYEVKSNDHF